MPSKKKSTFLDPRAGLTPKPKGGKSATTALASVASESADSVAISVADAAASSVALPAVATESSASLPASPKLSDLPTSKVVPDLDLNLIAQDSREELSFRQSSFLAVDSLFQGLVVPISEPEPAPASSSSSPLQAVVAQAGESPLSHTDSPSPPTEKLWSSRLKDSTLLQESGTPTEHITGVPFILIPDENVEEAKEEFKDYIYAQFHGEAPDMGRVIGVVNALWARSGPRIFVHKIGEGTFLLRVSNIRTREILLSRNLWNIAGKPMFVAPWSPNFTPEKPPLTKARVMVEFRGIPYLLFKTERKENFEVAKILVEVNLLKELPSKLISGFSDGREFPVEVSYPWLPPKCSICSDFGHGTTHCPKRPLKDVVVMAKRSLSKGKRQRSASRKGRSRGRSRAIKVGAGRDILNDPVPQEVSIPAVNEADKGGTDKSLIIVEETDKGGTDLSMINVEGTADSVQVSVPITPQVVCGVSEPPGPQTLGAEDARSTLQETTIGLENSVRTQADQSEPPFLLVSNRKSSRKATISL
ncbi:hypothetical protein V5N11_016053 [Cardamine amara subsp. amara]|uniref:DUF4283 domain-containing protein n=1 Tax=Cardamine amara subsp. amara TaxID=228776 RepID=A0ABD1AEH9_CARAN